jgi:type VI secretion system secreted protein VgrG
MVVADRDAEQPLLDVQSLLYQPATLQVSYGDQVVRYVQGIIVRAREQLMAAESAVQRLTFEVAPPLALLKHARDSRVFLKQTTAKIVQTIFDANGLAVDALDFQQSGQDEREVCTQYEETSFDFVSRLLEESGIVYYFKHDASGLKMVFADSPGGFAQQSGPKLPLLSASGSARGESVQMVAPFKRMRPSKVVLRDRNFRQADQILEATAKDESGSGIEYYEYPGRFPDVGVGNRYASMRLEELRGMAEGLSGFGQAFSMTPGHKFVFEAPAEGKRSRPPAVDFDLADPESWVPVAVNHQWSRHEDGHAAVKTQFSARRGDLAYRPERRTPRARVKGPMLAMVTTRDPGEEIQCDEFGCVTVQFLWDSYGKQDDKSSGPVRVAQMQSSGSVAIPRRGWEVVVECEDGDPDKPIIVGRLYNSAQSPPASLPGEKTVTAFQSFSSPGGGGHNEIRINDGAGGELISSHAQKDMNVAVANDRNVHVANNSSVTVGANQTLSVGVARVEEVGANDSIAVTGNQSWTVGAVRTETITGDSAFGVNGNRDATIGATHMTLTPKSIDVSTAGNLTETVGGLCLEASALQTEMGVAGSYKATIGGAKIEAVAASKTEVTGGARTVLVGGAFINAAGKDVSTTATGKSTRTVGGVMLSAAGGTVNLSAKNNLKITVGAALAVTGTSVELKVGDSVVSLAAGAAVLKSKKIILEATGPNAELAPMVSSK